MINVGVIGLGVGERHAATYAAMDGVTLCRLADQNPTRLAEIAADHPDTRASSDWRDVTDDPEIGLVSICSWDNAHAEQCVRALRAGKHVMIEKPLALHRAELEAIVDAWEGSGLVLTSNLVLRASPRFQDLRAQVKAGRFGDLIYAESDYLHQILWKITEGWRSKLDFYCVTYGGGVHVIDLLGWIIGETIVEVSGMAVKKQTRGLGYRYPDLIGNFLRFESDLMAKTTSFFGPVREQLHTLNLYGTKQSFENRNGDAQVWRSDQHGSAEACTTPSYSEAMKGDLLPAVVRAVRDGTPPPVTTREIVRTMNVCFACWEAAESGKAQRVSYTLA